MNILLVKITDQPDMSAADGQLIGSPVHGRLLILDRLEYAECCNAAGLEGRVQSQWKAFEKSGVKENKACWQSLAKYYLGSTLASPAGTLYPGVTYLCS
jgi:hypothetical protein